MLSNPTHFRVSQKRAAKRYGVSQRTLKRRSQEKSGLNFPTPHKANGKAQYWNDELEAWDKLNPEFAPKAEGGGSPEAGGAQ